MTTTSIKFARAIRASAIYDILSVAPLALPGLAGLHLATLEAINTALGLGGSVGPMSPLAMMFINVAGSVLTIWAVLRLLNPSWLIGVADIAIRVLCLIALINAIILGVPGLIVVLVIIELGLLLAMAWYGAKAMREDGRGFMPMLRAG